MYADKITESMRITIEETNRRREKQLRYNEKHGITPTQIVKAQKSVLGNLQPKAKVYVEPEKVDYAADPVVQYMTVEQLADAIAVARKKMEAEAKQLNFIEAARYRDEMYALQKMLDEKSGSKSSKKKKSR
jgi:excinuclease ABC subunit B